MGQDGIGSSIMVALVAQRTPQGNLTSKSHVHPLTPVVGGSSGIGCNGGCDCRTFEAT